MNQSVPIAIIAGQLVVGGAERQLYLWLSHLDRKRFFPVVLTLHPGCNDYWEKPIEALNIPLLPIKHRNNRLLRLLDIVMVLRPIQPHLIHGWHLFTSPYAGVAAKLLGAKSLGGVRGSFSTLLSRSIEANLTSLSVDGLVVNSSTTANQLRLARKWTSKKIFEVQNAVEDNTGDRFSLRKELSLKFRISTHVVWVCSMGRMDPKKNFDMLLQIIALLKVDELDFHLFLFGDGPERIHLEELSDSLGVSGFVTFTGEVPEAGTWLSAMDIFCFSSLDEGSPNVVLEAGVSRLPVVAWRVPFMEDILSNGDMAFLVEPGDLFGFKNTLLDLIHDQKKREQIGKAARKHMLENFSIDRYIKNMTGVYDSLLLKSNLKSGKRENDSSLS